MDFGVLGPLEVSRRGRLVELGGAKQRTVLAHLILRANHVVSTDRLIDDVWGEGPPDAARSSLHAYVSRLRRVLGGLATIEGRPPGYVLRVDPARIDANRFTSLIEEASRLRTTRPEAALELLRDALGLWRGPALDDLADEPSLQAEIARMEELRLAAVEDRLDLEIAQGRPRDAAAELERLAREHPLRERMWGLLMLALYRSGRQGDALAAYLQARTVLHDELGVEPSPELQRLQAQILAHDPALSGGVGSVRGYELRERIGAGAFGVVYRAVQPRVGREVAVKAIHAHLAQRPEFIRRFEAEAQIVARIEHPRIVPLHDYWRGPDGAFLVMRWLRGGSLRDGLHAGRVDRAAAARIVPQVAAALAAAHRSGVVHADVSTSNILLDESGDAYLGDFGVATVIADAAAGAGLAHYLAPERERGEPPSPLSDQYSLGVVIRELVGESHPAVSAIVERATAADPGARFPDVEALAQAFAEASGEGPPSVSEPPTNPYKGLRPFEEADRDEFFGRAALVDELVAALAGPSGRFLAVVGASGSGKSSLVDAGLVPAVRAGAIPGSERWFVADMHPGAAPFRELDEALLRVGADAPPTFMDLLTADPRGLLWALEAALPDDGSELLLVIDQLEELFTLVPDERLRTRFLDTLVAAVTDRASRLRVVATLRADFFDRPLGHRGMAELLRDRTQAIVPLNADELADAVRLPAEGVGVEVEPPLVGAIVADVVDQPGALPLLQYALTELFERRRDGPMTLKVYRALGGIGGAVARRADELHGALDAAGREAARQLFLRLVTLGEGTEDTRRRVPLGELQAMEVDQAALTGVIEAFGRHRLLSFDRDPTTREPTVEVAHEALLRAWGRLRRWIEEARDDLRIHRHLVVASADWEAGGRDPSDLWRGARLEQAEAWAASGSVALTEAERAFIGASAAARDAEAAAEAERHRRELELERRSSGRLRALAVVLGVAAFVAAGLTGWALAQSDEAQRAARLATVRQLAAAANEQLSQDPELAVLLALEAVGITRDADGSIVPEAEAALHRALPATRVRLTVPSGGAIFYSPDGSMLLVSDQSDVVIVNPTTGEEVQRLSGHADEVFNGVIGPDGTIAATNAWDGTTRIWDLARGEAMHVIEGGAQPLSIAISPDGGLLALSRPDVGQVEVRDIASSDLVHTLESSEPSGVNFSPDGALLAAADGFAGVNVWNVGDGSLKVNLPTDGWPMTDVAFSADGQQLVAGGNDKIGTVWSLDGERLFSLFGHPGNIEGIAYSADGSLIATGGTDGSARVWDAATGRPILTLLGHDSAVANVAFSPDSSQLASGSSDGTARVWDITPSASREWLTVTDHPLAIDATLSRSGDLLATSGFNAEGRLYDAASGELLHVFPHMGPVRRIELSPDGSLAITASFDGTASVWDTETGELLHTLERTWGIGQALFSPDGSLIATADEGSAREPDLHVPGSVTIWDARTGEPRLEFAAAPGIVADLDWSDDGMVIATAGFDGSSVTWAAETGEQIAAFEGHLSQQAFSPFTAVLQVDVSPDGELVATASWDGTARLWEATTGIERLRVDGHGAEIWSVEFSPDGSSFVTGGSDGTARIWDVATGRELQVLPGHTAQVTGVEFSADGRRLITSSEDETVRIWALAIDDLVALAEDRLTRPLTDAECRQFLDLESCPDGG